MIKNTISVYELMKNYLDEESARQYFEKRYWNNIPKCPICGATEHQHKQSRDGKAGYYRCYNCKKVYTVRTGTILERSHIPLNKWVFAKYLYVTSRKGISSLQLSKELGITQESAWFMLQRIREACGDNSPTLLKGEVEADEAYFGGKEANKHESKKLKAGRGTVDKTIVLGMKERGGYVRAKVIKDTKAKTIKGELNKRIEKGSTLYTDEHPSYQNNKFKHKVVNHSAKQFVNGKAHTNSIESFWAVFKRGKYGIFHNISKKHHQRYADEFAFRQNEGNVKRHTTERMDSLTDRFQGKRLTYNDLKGGNNNVE